MKLTKIFGIVLSLHVAVILLVMFQPSCQTFPGKEEGEKPSGDEPSTDLNSGPKDGPSVTPPEPTKVAGGGERFPPTQPKPGELLVPKEPGTSLQPELRPKGVEIYKVKKGDTLWSIARNHNLTLDRLLSANDIDKKATLSVGQEIFLPVASEGKKPEPSPLITPEAPVPVSTGAEVHLVRRGDTLSVIAQSYGVSINALKDANNLRSDLIQIGQRLLVPGVSASPPPGEPENPSVAPVSIPGQVTHVVKAGENLTGIAARHGVNLQLLIGMNNIEDPGSLKVGQILIIKPAAISEETPSTPGKEETEDLEDIFKNAGEAPVIPLSSPKE